VISSARGDVCSSAASWVVFYRLGKTTFRRRCFQRYLRHSRHRSLTSVVSNCNCHGILVCQLRLEVASYHILCNVW